MANDDKKKRKDSINKDLQTLNDKLILARTSGNSKAIMSAERLIKKLEYELMLLKGSK